MPKNPPVPTRLEIHHKSFTLTLSNRRKHTYFVPRELILEMEDFLKTRDMVSLRGMIDLVTAEANDYGSGIHYYPPESEG